MILADAYAPHFPHRKEELQAQEAALADDLTMMMDASLGKMNDGGDENVDVVDDKNLEMANSGVESPGKGAIDYESENDKLRTKNDHRGEEKYYVNANLRIEDTIREEIDKN